VVTLNRTPREYLAKDASAALRSTGFFGRRLFYPLFIFGAVVLSIVIVRYNTVVHPFTLADNRHYMFYIFRYTIRRSQLIRFTLIPLYIVSARLVWSRLAGLPCESNFISLSRKDIQYVNRPFPRPDLVRFLVDERRSILARMPGTEQLTAQELKDIVIWVNETELRPGATPPPPAPQPTPRQPPSPPQKQSLIDLEDDASTSSDSPLTSTALLWLAATTLSLMTAPLVEPRYFILPWVFWRLLLPAWPTMYKAPQGSSRLFGWVTDISRRYDLTIFLETIWFGAINYATFWIFLNKPFVWKAENGTLLDGGRTQRFMW
jgi:alpha-1,2-glucosyltransferase